MKTLANVIIWLNFIIGLSFADYLSLEGSEWTAINRNKSISAKARVPGSIHSDLRRDNVLKEALYKGDNDIKYSWVVNDDWTYERTFNVESSLLSHESVQLVAHGIDTVSSIHINDKLIGNTDNMFVRYKFDAKQALKVGSNKISIAFKSAPNYGKEQSEAYKKTYGYSVPPGGDRNFVRKMQSSFSWDWGPSFPTQGIWKPIGIEAYNSAILRDFSVETTPDAKNSSLWTLTITAHLETAANKEIEGSFSIQLDEHKLVDNQNHALKPENGNTVKVKFVIPLTSIQITPWFPNGVADNTQKLYKLDVSLSVANTKEVSTKSVKIGFRKIELIQEPVKPDGLTFWFKVNGKPFFAKGSNWIPANILTEDISQEYLRHLLESAKEANMNMLRVWGGGIYETEWFYELTDELGIMLWQDMMFACALYPSDPNFLKSVDAEILDQVRRIQYHPSIAIWAGNNENQAALMDHWYNHDTTLDEKYKKDYVELYANHIRKIILAEDTSRPFVGSSPSNGLRSEQYNFIDTCPGCSKWGDVHFYDYNSPLWNWKVFPNARFSSEYGFQSYPSLETLSQVIDEKDLTYPVSNALIHHQRHGGGDSEMEKMIGHYFNLPSHGGKDRFNDMIYLSQVTQAMAMRTETEFYRRNRQINNNGEGYTMGALYWQLNDIWQGPTWASIEFGGKWKLLHNYAKNFFNNQLVSPFEDGTQIKIAFVRDDYLGDLTFNLSIKVFKWSSLKPIHEIKSEVKSGSFSANIVYDQPIANLLKESNCADKSECVVLVEAENTGHKLATHNFMLLSEPKNSKIVKPNVKLVDVKEKSKDNNRHVYDIVLSAEAVAPFVYLDFKLNSQIMGKFSDNGHFIFMSPTTIQFETKSNVSAQQIKDNLIIKTVTDIA